MWYYSIYLSHVWTLVLPDSHCGQTASKIILQLFILKGCVPPLRSVVYSRVVSSSDQFMRRIFQYKTGTRQRHCQNYNRFCPEDSGTLQPFHGLSNNKIINTVLNNNPPPPQQEQLYEILSKIGSARTFAEA